MARQSDLVVITKAKEMYSYILTVKQKSPKLNVQPVTGGVVRLAHVF